MRIPKSLAGLALAAVVASGCVAIPKERTDADAAWKPIPSESELTTVFENYEKVYNKANETEDANLIAQVESGPLLQASKTDYTIWAAGRRLGDEEMQRVYRKGTTDPVSRDNVEFFTPRITDYPAWFVARSDTHVGKAEGSENDEYQNLSLLSLDGAGAEWKVSASVWFSRKTELPALEQSGDFAVTIEPDDQARLGRSPQKVAEQFCTLVTSTEKKPEAADLFDSGDRLDDRRSWVRNRAQGETDGYIDAVFDAKPVDVRTFATEDGGALLLFTAESTETLTPRPGKNWGWDEYGAETTLLTGNLTFYTTISETYLWQVAAVVPPKDAKDQRIKLLGVEQEMLEASGS